MSMLSVLSGQGIPKWVSGTTYPLDAIVWSPTNYLPYVRIVAGAGTTDPSADGTNWALFGPSKIKSIQRGSISITGTNTSATATITAVNTAKTELRNLAASTTSVLTTDMTPSVVLTNSTTVTASRGTPGSSVTHVVQFEVTEWW